MFGSHHPRASTVEHEIQVLTRRLEKLKRKAGRDSHRTYAQFKQGAEELLDHSQEHWQYLAGEGRKLGKQAKQCVEQNPAASVAIGIGALAVLGWLLCKR